MTIEDSQAVADKRRRIADLRQRLANMAETITEAQITIATTTERRAVALAELIAVIKADPQL